MAPQDGLTATLTRAETTAPTLQRSTPLCSGSTACRSPTGRTRSLPTSEFELGRGQSLALIGESGSGKSTIARAVLRLLPSGGHATGRIEFDGQEVLGFSERRLPAAAGTGHRVRPAGSWPTRSTRCGRSAPRRRRQLHSSTSPTRRAASSSSWRRSPRSGSTTPSVSTTPTRTSCRAACCSAC